MAAAAAEEVEDEEEKEAKNPSDGGLSGGFGMRSICIICCCYFSEICWCNYVLGASLASP